jgi:hypothetical protein
VDHHVGAAAQGRQRRRVGQVAADRLGRQVGRVAADQGADGPARRVQRLDQLAAEESGRAGDRGDPAQAWASAWKAPAR